MIDLTKHANIIYKIVVESVQRGYEPEHRSFPNSGLHSSGFDLMVDGEEYRILIESNAVVNHVKSALRPDSIIFLHAYLTLPNKFLIEAKWDGYYMPDYNTHWPNPQSPEEVRYYSHAFTELRFDFADGMTQDEFDHLMLLAAIMMKEET